MLSNPLSGGELVLVGITGIIGYGIADFVGRYMSTTAVATGGAANSIPTGAVVGNDVATQAFPSWQSMAAQLGVAAVPGIAAAFVDSPWGRAALQGMMLGAGFSLFGGLFKSLMASMIGTTALGQQLYLAETEAQAAVTAATPAAGTAPTTTAPTAPAPTGFQGLPRGVGARPALRDPGPMARGVGQTQVRSMVPPPRHTNRTPPPMTLPPNVGAFVPGMTPNTPPFSPGGPGQAPPGLPSTSVPPPIDQPAIPIGHPARPIHQPPGILTNTGDVLQSPSPGTPTPGGPSTGPMCAPCTSTNGGLAATHQSAMDAIRDESCLGALPTGFGMYASFPDDAAA